MVPETIIWLVTSKCNLACPHCYATRFIGSFELDTKDALRLIYEAYEAGVQHIAFTGGEPLTRHDILHLIDEASNLGISSSLNTNGVLMNKKIAKFLANHDVFVYLSIDGAKKATHEAIRGIGTWAHINRAMDYMNKFGVEFATIMAVGKYNWSEVKDYVEYALSKNAAYAVIIPVMSVGRAKKEYILSPEELISVIRGLDEKVEELGYVTSVWCVPFAKLFIKSKRVFSGSCRDWDVLDISPSGDTLLCDVLDIRTANVRNGSLTEAYINHLRHPLVKAVSNPELRKPCVDCPLKSECLGGCFARAKLMTGDIFSPDPLCIRVRASEQSSYS